MASGLQVGKGASARADAHTDTASLHQSYQTTSQGAEPTYRAARSVTARHASVGCSWRRRWPQVGRDLSGPGELRRRSSSWLLRISARERESSVSADPLGHKTSVTYQESPNCRQEPIAKRTACHLSCPIQIRLLEAKTRHHTSSSSSVLVVWPPSKFRGPFHFFSGQNILLPNEM